MHEVIVKGILSARNGMNLYRGCTHGCIYRDSRSSCYQIEVLNILKDAGIPMVVWMTPILPFLNDTEEKHLMALVQRECEKANIEWRANRIFAYLHQFEDKQAGQQMTLFYSKRQNNLPFAIN